MQGKIEAFEPREGVAYCIVLTYDDLGHSIPGKISNHADVVRGRFVELAPHERIVQTAVFDSEDPAFAGRRP